MNNSSGHIFQPNNDRQAGGGINTHVLGCTVKQKKAYRYKKISVRGRKIDEHRYVMEQHIGRYLQTYEVVRHRNNDTKDNRIENLYIINRKLQPYTQMAEGTHHAYGIEDIKKSTISCRKKFGKRIMICDRSGKELMIVGSIRFAAKIIGCSTGNANAVYNGKRNHVHGFKFCDVV